MVEDVLEKWKKEKEAIIKKVASDKKLKEIIDKYNKKEISGEELEKYFTGRELFHLLNDVIKPWKTPEEIRREEELARVKRFEESLSPDDLKVRRELIDFLADFNFEAHLCFYTPPDSYHTGPFVDKCFEKGKLLGKKYPIERVKKVLTPKEFEEIKKLLYPEDKSN